MGRRLTWSWITGKLTLWMGGRGT